jgi:hypothetical protein
MKLLLIALTSLIIAVSARAGQDHLERGEIISHGVRIISLYHIAEGQDTEVHLFFPDGSNVGIMVQAGTATAVMDKS